MRLIASEIITLHRPTPCEFRVHLRYKDAPEAEPGPFDEVLRRLGIRHEAQHLKILGAYVDLILVPEHDRVKETLKAIATKAAVIYQPAFFHACQIDGVDVAIVGTPD